MIPGKETRDPDATEMKHSRYLATLDKDLKRIIDGWDRLTTRLRGAVRLITYSALRDRIRTEAFTSAEFYVER